MGLRISTVFAAILLGGTALALAGCGSGGSAAQSSSDQASSGSAPVAARKSLPPAPGLLSSKYCDELYNISKSYSAALTGDPADLDATAAVLKDLAVRAPSDIRPDFIVLAHAYARIISALKGVDPGTSSTPSPAVIAKLTKLGHQIDMVRFGEASTNMGTWASQNCPHFELNSNGP